MEENRLNGKTWMAGGMAAVVLAGAFAAGPSQAGAGGGGKDEVTIKAVLDGKRPEFTGPSKVERGAKLTFLNASDPKKIGPHTLSLVEKKLVPVVRSRKDGKACFTSGLCGTIAEAHKYDPKTDEINKPSIDVGRKGAWDTAFGKKGDSFYTETEGGNQTRKVVAPVGARLTLFCAVHPEMVKTIKVVE